ncbi:GerAB/ArcD/ProY family transporter [Bacillus thuringiensis]|uniref:GerAB/ArcD/ProY family transporter n=1 Tax=Bacillus thuringiensis TaxID=1428 RepID=UPI0026864BEF
MIKENHYIKLTQYIFIINGVQVGTGVLSLPRVVAEKAGTDGWIAILVGWLCSIISSTCLIQAVQTIPHDSLKELLQKFFGKWIGHIFICSYILYFFTYYWIVMMNSILFIKGWFLPHTPEYLLFALLCIPTYMIVHKGRQSVGKYCEFIFYMTLWIPFFFFIPSVDGDKLYFMPLLKNGIFPILQAVPTTAFSFLGFEICIVLYPYLQKKQYAIHGVFIANTITMLFYLFTTLICFHVFGPDSITQFSQPVLDLLKQIEFRFLERFDMVLLLFYLLVVSTSWVSFICGSLLLMNPTQKSPSLSYQAFCILMIGMGLAVIFPLSWEQSEQYQKGLSYIGIIIVYCFSLLLWLYQKSPLFHNRRKLCSKEN